MRTAKLRLVKGDEGFCLACQMVDPAERRGLVKGLALGMLAFKEEGEHALGRALISLRCWMCLEHVNAAGRMFDRIDG